MLRRPATVLTITAEDIAAYEDRQERAAFRAAATAAQQGYPQQQYVDAGGFTSSGDEFVSDDEAMVDAFDAQHHQAQAQAAATAMRAAHLQQQQQQQQPVQAQGMQTPMQAQLQTPIAAGQGYDGAGTPGIGAGPARHNGLPEPQVPQAPQRQRAGRGAQPMPQQGQGQGQGAQGAAVTPEGRVTRSRDERIGIARGAGRR